MIKLTSTQAKAVACKIRERVTNLRNKRREQLRQHYRSTDEYKTKQQEVHEVCMAVYKASLKLNLKLGINASRYCSYELLNEKDVEHAEEYIMGKLEETYVLDNCTFPTLPTEEKLTQDLIFESLMSEGIEELMDKFIELYL